jgi:hypothetical protein
MLMADFALQNGKHLEALVYVLEAIPADKRQELIARALETVGQKERREVLLEKLQAMETDELERLVG